MGKKGTGASRRYRVTCRERGDKQYERRLQTQARLYNERTGRELAPGALRGFAGFQALVPPKRDEGGGGDGGER